VPFRLLREVVWARSTARTVEMFHRGKRVAAHMRSSSKKYITVRDHMPSSHQRYAEWTPEGIKQQAAQIGPNTAALVETIMRERAHPEQGFRACIGIMRLVKSYGCERAEAACGRALEIGARSYTSVKSILKNNLDGKRPATTCLYGLGTNAGLKRMSAGRLGVSYKELLHTRRRYVDQEALRAAIRRVVDATFHARRPDIWGEGTTACAADGKKFGAWDQNLMTEWHIRYGGRGVMIYWHVERKSACIYSQVKRCSSSEVAAMIEGVLRHDTEMEVDRSYVDSHGQSEVAFAFCRLLGFTLLPRLAIATQRLYLPTSGTNADYPNLAPVLARPIDWQLVEQQYDEMVRYSTALAERTADPEVILRRFTRGLQHPTYRALAELGKAVKTIFLCRYLDSEALRREIHEGLNVIENWNSANGFIFFGKGGEVASNRLEDQASLCVALHLLQSCLVYINTLMLQLVLAEPGWWQRMADADRRGLSPLVWATSARMGSSNSTWTAVSTLS
jgi:TnpA family transposase